MRVRRLDWEEALQSVPTQPLRASELEPGPDSAQLASSSPPPITPGMAVQPQQTATGACNLASPPNVAREDQFEVILGTDIMYEVTAPSLLFCWLCLASTLPSLFTHLLCRQPMPP